MKTIFGLALVLLVAIGCSKDQITNRQLDGTWDLLEINEDRISENVSGKLVFDKDFEGEGTGIETYNGSLNSYSENFNYKIQGDEVVIDKSGDIETYFILSLDQINFKFNDGDDTYLYVRKD